MSLLKLCKGDILTETLRDVFHATPISTPEKRILPMSVVARKGHQTAFRGDLKYLIEDFDNFHISISSGEMADISGKRSKSVDLDFGLKILDGFLSGFGIPSAGVSAKFHNAKKVSFSFKNVERKYIDINEFGYILTDKKLNLSNPAIAIFINQPSYDMLLIDSIITSSDFTIAVEEGKDVKLDLAIDEIKGIISQANAKLNVNSYSGLDLTFSGEDSLTFAFSTVQLFINEETKKITSINPAKQIKLLESIPNFEHTLFDNENVIIQWDKID